MGRVVTLGADPELPVMSTNTTKATLFEYENMAVGVPACGLIGGTKGQPKMVSEELGGWLEDGVMVELNPKASTSARIVSRNTKGIWDAVEAALNEKKLKTFVNDSVFYNPDDLRKHPSALEFGCAKDYSAYERGDARECPMPQAMQEYGENIRFAGGHIHLGISDWPEELPKFIAIRLIDLLVGYPYAVASGWMSERNNYYGLPGLYRETSYGIEYRTPSNKWLMEVKNGKPYLLARLKLVGKLLADFENTKGELVKLYNSVDWAGFQECFTGRRRDNLSFINPEMLYADNYVSLGKAKLCLVDHKHTLNERGNATITNIFEAGDLDESMPKAELREPFRNEDGDEWQDIDWTEMEQVTLWFITENLGPRPVQRLVPGDSVSEFIGEAIDQYAAYVSEFSRREQYIVIKFPENTNYPLFRLVQERRDAADLAANILADREPR